MGEISWWSVDWSFLDGAWISSSPSMSCSTECLWDSLPSMLTASVESNPWCRLMQLFGQGVGGARSHGLSSRVFRKCLAECRLELFSKAGFSFLSQANSHRKTLYRLCLEKARTMCIPVFDELDQHCRQSGYGKVQSILSICHGQQRAHLESIMTFYLPRIPWPWSKWTLSAVTRGFLCFSSHQSLRKNGFECQQGLG